MDTSKAIMIVAGEASGDSHGAKLVQALRDAEPQTRFEFFGAAGPRLRDVGVDAIVRADELSIVGLLEIAAALPMFIRAFRKLRRAAIRHKPEAVILVDFPDFNLRLAKSLKRKGFKIIYYISPQLWAWRKYRVRSNLPAELCAERGFPLWPAIADARAASRPKRVSTKRPRGRQRAL